jgi:hypothetical protein
VRALKPATASLRNGSAGSIVCAETPNVDANPATNTALILAIASLPIRRLSMSIPVTMPIASCIGRG